MQRSYMQESARSAMSTADQVNATTSFINRVYGWMSTGLVITGIIAYLIGTNVGIMETPQSKQKSYMGSAYWWICAYFNFKQKY